MSDFENGTLQGISKSPNSFSINTAGIETCFVQYLRPADVVLVRMKSLEKLSNM